MKLIGLFLSGVNFLSRHWEKWKWEWSSEAPVPALEGPSQLHFLLLGRKRQDESEISKSLLSNESSSSFPTEKWNFSVRRLIISCINYLFCKQDIICQTTITKKIWLAQSFRDRKAIATHYYTLDQQSPCVYLKTDLKCSHLSKLIKQSHSVNTCV